MSESEEQKKSRYTEAQAKAIKRYMHENVQNLQIRVPKGRKEVYKEHAARQGESLNQFAIRAMDEAMERDNQE